MILCVYSSSGDPDDVLLGKNIFYLVIEGEVVNEVIADFWEVVMALFASYYVLNIMHPQKQRVHWNSFKGK